MLVLSRKLHETILIGDAIRVTVVGIQGHQIRLGIEAPAEVPIMREELGLRAKPVAAEVADARDFAGGPLARNGHGSGTPHR
jgi:carbon storage regulator